MITSAVRCFPWISKETTIFKGLRLKKPDCPTLYWDVLHIVHLTLMTEEHVQETRVVSALRVTGWTSGWSACQTRLMYLFHFHMGTCASPLLTCSNTGVLLLSKYTYDCSTCRKSVSTPAASKHLFFKKKNIGDNLSLSGSTQHQ